jgi:hypothetical protein
LIVAFNIKVDPKGKTMSTEDSTTINLTESQADWAEWAALRVTIYYISLKSNEEIEKLPPFPEIEGLIMHLTLDEGVLTTLLDMLEHKAAERAKEGGLPESAANSAISLAKKIRAVTGYQGIAA